MGWQMGVGEKPHDRYLSPEQAKRFYDRLGARQDWQGFYENAALQELIAHAGFDSARSVFEFGCGTGAFAARLLQQHLPADARYTGLDVSSTMVSLARKRLQPWPERAHVHQSDGSFRIHQADRSFDRFVSNYVFDLLAPGFAEQLLLEALPGELDPRIILDQ
jgi:trans-aconitate methyltransferase